MFQCSVSDVQCFLWLFMSDRCENKSILDCIEAFYSMSILHVAFVHIGGGGGGGAPPPGGAGGPGAGGGGGGGGCGTPYA